MLFKIFTKARRTRMGAMKGKTRRKATRTDRAGRPTRIVRYRPGENQLAPLATVVASVLNAKYDVANKHLKIEPDDFVGYEHLERESITLIMLVDVSRSTYPFIKVFAEIINSLTSYFKSHRDRLGLIALQGLQARIMNHPTQNYRVVTRNLLDLKIHGDTPLADGLAKALVMANLEGFRKPGSRRIAVLLSDCTPEPVSGQFADLLDEPAYRGAVRVAAHYRQRRISLLVINPSLRRNHDAAPYPGERLARLIVKESKGKLIVLSPLDTGGADQPFPRPAPRDITNIMRGIEELVGSKVGQH